MAQRLTQAEAEELRGMLLKLTNEKVGFQSAREWQRCGLSEYTVAQVKRQLEVLVRAKKIDSGCGYPGQPAVYGAFEHE